MENFSPSPLSHLSIFGYNKQKPSEQAILNGVKNNDDTMYRFIYKNYFPGIRTMVLGFRSLALDAEDIFQDGLEIASRNVMEGRFKGESAFSTYLSGICRNICRKQLERADKLRAAAENAEAGDDSTSATEELIDRITLLKEKMDEKCRQIIDLRFGLGRPDGIKSNEPGENHSVKFEDIAVVLGIEADNARQRFRRCIEKLREAVFSDTAWKNLVSTIN